MKRFIPALVGVAALALLSGCVVGDGYYDGYDGGRFAGNYGYGGANARNYGYDGYGSDPYDGYGYDGGYGYPYYDYYATPFTTFGLGLGLGCWRFRRPRLWRLLPTRQWRWRVQGWQSKWRRRTRRLQGTLVILGRLQAQIMRGPPAPLHCSLGTLAGDGQV